MDNLFMIIEIYQLRPNTGSVSSELGVTSIRRCFLLEEMRYSASSDYLWRRSYNVLYRLFNIDSSELEDKNWRGIVVLQ